MPVQAGYKGTKAEEDARQAERLLQEGIDNIMGYQWPPRREGE